MELSIYRIQFKYFDTIVYSAPEICKLNLTTLFEIPLYYIPQLRIACV